MDLVLDIPETWKPLLGLDAGNAAGRARDMLVIESYRQGRISRGQAAEMLGLGFHEAEVLFKRCGAEQQPTWNALEDSSHKLRTLLGA